MAIDLSKETLGFAAYRAYFKKSSPDVTDEQWLSNWHRPDFETRREYWDCAALGVIEEHVRRIGASECVNASFDILAITRDIALT